jgi:hypothetical protein
MMTKQETTNGLWMVLGASALNFVSFIIGGAPVVGLVMLPAILGAIVLGWRGVRIGLRYQEAGEHGTLALVVGIGGAMNIAGGLINLILTVIMALMGLLMGGALLLAGR